MAISHRRKTELYKVAGQDYLLAVEDTVKAGSYKEDFIHTEYVALLLTEQRRIRHGFMILTKESVQKLIEDIDLLLKD